MPRNGASTGSPPPVRLTGLRKLRLKRRRARRNAVTSSAIILDVSIASAPSQQVYLPTPDVAEASLVDLKWGTFLED